MAEPRTEPRAHACAYSRPYASADPFAVTRADSASNAGADTRANTAADSCSNKRALRFSIVESFRVSDARPEPGPITRAVTRTHPSTNANSHKCPF